MRQFAGLQFTGPAYTDAHVTGPPDQHAIAAYINLLPPAATWRVDAATVATIKNAIRVGGWQPRALATVAERSGLPVPTPLSVLRRNDQIAQWVTALIDLWESRPTADATTPSTAAHLEAPAPVTSDAPQLGPNSMRALAAFEATFPTPQKRLGAAAMRWAVQFGAAMGVSFPWDRVDGVTPRALLVARRALEANTAAADWPTEEIAELLQLDEAEGVTSIADASEEVQREIKASEAAETTTVQHLRDELAFQAESAEAEADRLNRQIADLTRQLSMLRAILQRIADHTAPPYDFLRSKVAQDELRATVYELSHHALSDR